MPRKPVVLFIVPDKYTVAYAGIANKLSEEALRAIGGSIDDVELLGYMSLNSEFATNTLHFLAHAGIEPYDVVAMMLFGEAAEQFNFDSAYADGPMLSTVILPSISATFPTICIPALDTGWYKETDQWERARECHTRLLRDGRKALVGGEPYRFVVRNNAIWN